MTFHFGVSLDAIPSNNVGEAIEVLELCIVGSRTAAVIIDEQRGGIRRVRFCIGSVWGRLPVRRSPKAFPHTLETVFEKQNISKRKCVEPSACETVT